MQVRTMHSLPCVGLGFDREPFGWWIRIPGLIYTSVEKARDDVEMLKYRFTATADQTACRVTRSLHN